MKLAALVPVVGDGRRRQARVGLPYPLLAGRPVLAHTLERLERCPMIDAIFPIVPPEDLEYVQREVVGQGRFEKVEAVLPGGLLRQDYVLRALQALGDRFPLVMIHDANRALVPMDLLERTISAAEVHGAAVAAGVVHDTLKTVTRDNFVTSSLDRRRLRSIQTPMVFRYDMLMRAHQEAARENFYGSDECFLVERLGERVKVVTGSRFNLYVSTRDDITFAELLLQIERRAQPGVEEDVG